MKIVVRTRNFQIFLFFFSTFLLHYPDKLSDLIVLIQEDETDNVTFYKALLEDYNVEIKILKHWESDIEDNGWATMIYRSLQYDYVVSLDDDIVFTNPGLFDRIDEVFLETGKELLSFSYEVHNPSKELILSSYCLCKKGGVIKKEEFKNLKEIMNNYNGVDSAYLKFYHSYEFLDKYIVNKKNGVNKNFIVTPYFVHVGSISCLYNNIYKKGNK